MTPILVKDELHLPTFRVDGFFQEDQIKDISEIVQEPHSEDVTKMEVAEV